MVVEAGAPADLRLEWPDGRREREALRGRAGETVGLDYVVRNVGGRDAFAAIVSSHTALGRLRPDERLNPGPEAGRQVERQLRVALADGMRELCLQVRLQTLEAGEPADPNRDDNRLCCAVEITAGSAGGGESSASRDPAEFHSSGPSGKGEAR